MADKPVCSIPDCDKPAHSRGWCHAHYRRWYQFGSALAGGPIGTAKGAPKRFMESILSHTDPIQCLTWPFATAGMGYGVVHHAGSMRYAHRLICERVHGPAPTSEHEVAHSCGNGRKACVNRHHLSWKTHIDNVADQITHGTRVRGENHYRARLTADQVRCMRNMPHRTVADIAVMFGVNPGTAADAIARRTWAWLD